MKLQCISGITHGNRQTIDEMTYNYSSTGVKVGCRYVSCSCSADPLQDTRSCLHRGNSNKVLVS